MHPQMHPQNANAKCIHRLWRDALCCFAGFKPLGNPEKSKVFILEDSSSGQSHAEHQHPWGREPRDSSFLLGLSIAFGTWSTTSVTQHSPKEGFSPCPTSRAR